MKTFVAVLAVLAVAAANPISLPVVQLIVNVNGPLPNPSDAITIDRLPKPAIDEDIYFPMPLVTPKHHEIVLPMPVVTPKHPEINLPMPVVTSDKPKILPGILPGLLPEELN